MTPRAVLPRLPGRKVNNCRGQTLAATRPALRFSLSFARSKRISGRCEVRGRQTPVACRAAGSGECAQTHGGAAAVFRPIGMYSEAPRHLKRTAGNHSRSWHVPPRPRPETVGIRPPKTTLRSRREPAPASKAPNAAVPAAAVAVSLLAERQLRLSTPTSAVSRTATPQLRRRFEPGA